MVESCPFCNSSEIEIENEFAMVVLDKFPVTLNHCLIIPKRHEISFFNLTMEEQLDCLSLINTIKPHLCSIDTTISGFNIGINDGNDAGQTIPHCHIHLIPRRKNDVQFPMGGIRHVIPEKGYYEKSLKIIQT